MFIDLISGVALLLSLSFLQSFILRFFRHDHTKKQVLSGILFGVICVIGMMTPIVLAPGTIFDARSIVLSIAGLFCGAWATLIAVVIAGAYRLWLGGGGVVVGVAVIISSALLGLAYRYACNRGWSKTGTLHFLVFGLLVHIIVLLLFTQLPADVSLRTMQEIALPLLLVFTPGTAFFAWLIQDIERRIQTENALQHSEARLRAFYELGLVGIAITSPDKGWVSVNQYLCDMLEYSELALKELTWAELTHPDDLARDVSMFEQLAQGQIEGYSLEKRFISQTGKTIFTNLVVRCVRHPDRTIDYVVAMVEDISERKSVEAALLKSESLFRDMYEKAPLPYQSLDIEGNILDVNEAWLTLVERPRDEIIGHFIGDFMNEASIETLADEFPKFQQCGRVDGARFTFFRNDGTQRLLTVNGQIARAPDGSFLRTHCILTDITESVESEQQLRIAAAAFESREPMFITDVTDKILKVNQAFTDVTGFSDDDAVGQSMASLRAPVHDDEFYADMHATVRNTGVWQGEICCRRKSGELFPAWLSITAVRDKHSAITHLVFAFDDITQRKAAENQIQYLAFFDSLTGLPNRQLFADRLKLALFSSKRSKKAGALLFIDLDDFKTLNDSHGHAMGDQLLVQVAERLKNNIRAYDTAARLSGDEFVVILDDLSTEPDEAASQAGRVAEKLIEALRQTYDLNGHEYHGTASVGVALFSDLPDSLDELMKRADLAMYDAKAKGRDTIRFFDPAMQTAITVRTDLATGLREGLKKNQFSLHYQPQVDEKGNILGAEALLRWRHPKRGMVSPGEFIPLAEETGAILPIGNWVLETACAQLASWSKRSDTQHLTLAVNISERQIRQPDFVEQVSAMIGRFNVPRDKLKLELVESLLLDNIESIIAKMNALKARGVGFALDDFGTGYSSLSHLKQLPLDQLKIDQSFVRDVLTDPNDASIARTIIALAKTLGFSVIAEGVETEPQRKFLLDNDCQNFQGYLFSRPVPIAEFEKLISRAST